MTHAGLPDWIAKDADDYVAKAVRHAGDVPRLAAVRQSLRQRIANTPIFDTARFAHHFDTALRGMWMKWCIAHECAKSPLVVVQ
jgi:predicted O-linked N-acetylglucosamine transferase (SPINDLY family)